VTLNAKIGFLWIFQRFWAATHFKSGMHSQEMVAPSGVCKYIVPNVSCWIDEFRFVRSGPSNMHRYRAFPVALAGLFLSS